jgi:hypothetical protein
MKIKLKGFINVMELAGFLGTMLLAIVLLCFSMSKGYLVEGFAGLAIYFASMYIYNRINKGMLLCTDIKEKESNPRYRIHLLNAKRLFSYMLSIWGVTILLFAMSYLRFSTFPIKLFFAIITILFMIFFAESIVKRTEFVEKKVPIFSSILAVAYFIANQTIEAISMAFFIVLISLVIRDMIKKYFDSNISTYNALIVEIANNNQNRNMLAIFSLIAIFVYCYLSNIISYWELMFGTIAIAMIFYFAYEQISDNTKYSSPDEYFYKNTCYSARNTTKVPRYANGDWIDRFGNRWSETT